jgi:hypothetical protein
MSIATSIGLGEKTDGENKTSIVNGYSIAVTANKTYD